MSAYVIVLALIGPENHGSHFEESKPAFEASPSKDDVNFTREHEIRDVDRSSVGSAAGKEKEVIEVVEVEERVRKVSYV